MALILKSRAFEGLITPPPLNSPIAGAMSAVYRDLHEHPELSMQEMRTSGTAAGRLRSAGDEVTPGVGKAGVVGLVG